MRALLAFVLVATIGAGPKPNDPLQAYRFMIGSWRCSFTAGTQTAWYDATMSWAIGGTRIRERDTWAGGGGDEGFFTYDPVKRQWSFIAMESDRRPTLFVADGTGGAHIVYRSVYPDTSMRETIERISATKYDIHFEQVVGGKTTRSVDVCTKR